MGASSAGRAAVRRWAEEEPAFAGATSSLDVLARCQRHGDGHEALAAVLRLAGTDDFARQTVMQAILPGLIALARRAHYMVGPGLAGWASNDKLEQEMVTIAYGRILALGGTTQAWPANTLLAQTTGRLRVRHQTGRRRDWWHVPLDDVSESDVPPGRDRSPAEELAQVVIDAVRDGISPRGRLGCSTRVAFSARVRREPGCPKKGSS
ncbi:MAG TPA: hypothetical protein VGV93_11710 [Acidimicrobiales bacterium]|nr:hypothetical protein [Acidimicrobiales bacterium]